MQTLSSFPNRSHTQDSTVNAVELGIPRIQGMPPSGNDTINYGDLTLNLILDEDLSAYREMQTWLEECVYKKGETVNHDVTVIILNRSTILVVRSVIKMQSLRS